MLAAAGRKDVEEKTRNGSVCTRTRAGSLTVARRRLLPGAFSIRRFRAWLSAKDGDLTLTLTLTDDVSRRLQHRVQTPKFRVRAHTPAQQASSSAAGPEMIGDARNGLI